MTESNLPKKKDFDPTGCNLDAECAWKNFGGLNIDQAYELFCKAPHVYQEDFMFMGPAALAYYFPVLEKYLINVSSEKGYGDKEARIIACGLSCQFGYNDASKIDHLKGRVKCLAEFVLKNIHCFGEDEEERTQVETEWQKLIEQIK